MYIDKKRNNVVMIYIACVIIGLSNVSFVASMEKERLLPVIKHETYPSYIITTPAYFSYINPMHISNQIIPAMEPGWEKLNEIANISYTSINCTVEPLQPVYHDKREQRERDSSQSFVRTNNLPPLRKEHMQRLYEQVKQLIDPENITSKYSQRFTLMMHRCINDCNTAKQLYDITEDRLGKFAFKQHNAWEAALFFSSLKQYNKAIILNDEKMPLHFGGLSDLAQALGLSLDMLNKPLSMTIAMKLFVEDICHINRAKKKYSKVLVSLLYSGKKIVKEHEGCIVVDPEWRKLFFDDAFRYLWRPVKLGGLLDAMITKLALMKKAECFDNDYSFVNFAFNYDPGSLERFKMAWIEADVSYVSQKNKVALLSVLIAKYNSARGSKINPTNKDLGAYLLAKKLHIALPDSCDASLLDPQRVAFQEKSALINQIDDLVECSCYHAEKYAACLSAL